MLCLDHELSMQSIFHQSKTNLAHHNVVCIVGVERSSSAAATWRQAVRRLSDHPAFWRHVGMRQRQCNIISQTAAAQSTWQRLIPNSARPLDVASYSHLNDLLISTCMHTVRCLVLADRSRALLCTDCLEQHLPIVLTHLAIPANETAGENTHHIIELFVYYVYSQLVPKANPTVAWTITSSNELSWELVDLGTSWLPPFVFMYTPNLSVAKLDAKFNIPVAIKSKWTLQNHRVRPISITLLPTRVDTTFASINVTN